MNSPRAVALATIVLTASASTVMAAGRLGRRAGLVNANLTHRRRRPLPEATYRFSVVVPAYCETGIGETVLRLRTELAGDRPDGDLEIVVVDDGSPDGTAELARLAGADQVLRLPVNRGKGAAVRAGMLAARGRVVAFTDADLSYAPAHLAELLDEIESGWDVAVGSREHEATTTLVPASMLRRFGHRAVALATRSVLVGRHSDTQCGLKAFRADVARTVFSRARIDRFAFDVEILHLIERLGYSVHEVPVSVVNSDHSTVRVGRDSARLARDLIRIRWYRRRGAYDRGPHPVEVDAVVTSPPELVLGPPALAG